MSGRVEKALIRERWAGDEQQAGRQTDRRGMILKHRRNVLIKMQRKKTSRRP